MAVQRVVLGKVAGPKGERGNPGERGPLPIIQAEAGPNINVTGTPAVTVRDIEGGASFVFNYLKGEKGDKGDPGESIVGPQGAPGAAGPTGPAPDVTVAPGSDIAQVGTPSVSSVQDPVTGLVTLTFHQLKGETGQTGATGATGATGPEGPAGSSIASIVRTGGDGSAGSLDTYTITLTNGNTSTFTVQNGANGQAQSLTSISTATATTTNAEEEDEGGGTTYLGYKTTSITLPNRAVFIGYGIYDSSSSSDPTTDDIKVVSAYEYQWALGVGVRIEIASSNEPKDYYIRAYYYVS